MPYIPIQHQKYDLLPLCRNSGGEVFDYPGKLISQAETLIGSSDGLFPYNSSSYEEYYQGLNALMVQYADCPHIVDVLLRVKQRVIEMNQKEEWSVLKYMGPTTDINGFFGLTHGKNYYWPTRKSKPVYCGVIDDEEFTSYLYPTDAHLWEILEDPTGMAFRTIYESGTGHMSTAEYDHMMEQFGCVFLDTQE